MRNKILYSVVNRALGFGTPFFPEDITFAPYKETSITKELRSILHLDVQNEPYYIISVLKFIDAFQDIKDTFNAYDDYSLLHYRFDPYTITGGTLLPSAKGYCNVHPVNSKFPILKTIVVTPGDLGGVTITTNVKTYSNVATRVIEGANKLIVEWPEELGIEGILEHDGTFQSDSPITINVTPRSYPFEYVIDKIDKVKDLNGFLLNLDLLERYRSEPILSRKIAVICLALGLSNKHVYN